MRMLVLLLAAVVASAGFIRGEISTPQNVPMEITSTGETTYENGLATARDNVAIHIGNVPVFWWPYLYQSLSDTFSFSVTPAYTSTWGPSLLTQFMFPITDYIKARLRLDYFGRRGPAIGFDPVIDYGKDQSSQARLKTFYIDDQNPDINQTNVPRKDVPTNRYRLSLEDRTNFTDSIYATANITKLSDAYVMQDYYPGEFR